MTQQASTSSSTAPRQRYLGEPDAMAGRLVSLLKTLAEDRLLPLAALLARRGLVPSWAVAPAQAMSRTYVAAEEQKVRKEQHVLSALGTAGGRTLVLKGALLARTVYAGLGHRIRTDLDVLIAQDSVPAAAAVLRGIGLQLAQAVPGNVSLAEQAWVDRRSGSTWSVDLHWQLLMHPAFASTFSFQELWDESIPLPDLPNEVRGLSPKHAFLHACLHYYSGGQHRGGRAPLVWVLDMDLIWRELDENDRNAVISLAIDRGFASFVAAALRLAEGKFQTPVDPATVDCLETAGIKEWRAWLLRPFQSKLHDALFEIRSEPNVAAKVRRLAAMLFPAAGYMKSKYPDGSVFGLPGLYLRRIVNGLRRYLPQTKSG